jgi:ankyrin repeat protein
MICPDEKQSPHHLWTASRLIDNKPHRLKIEGHMNRRHFFAASIAASTVGTAVSRASGQSTQLESAAKPTRQEVIGGPHLDPTVVNEFVGACHNNLARVKEMLAEESPEQRRLGGLILAERELGLGDLETALGGASHMGQREIALFLLDHGARIDVFCAAMLGHRNVVSALLKAVPQTATTKGPHSYTLLYHAAISGNVDIAEDIKPLLPEKAADFNQALTSAARAGHLEMIRWLLENGVTNPNAKDGVGNTALLYAVKNNFLEVAAQLRAHGAK